MTRRSFIECALGAGWQRLPEVIRRHYAPLDAGEVRVMRGVMTEIDRAPLAMPLVWAARLAGALVPRRGREVAVEVRNFATEEGGELHWTRRFLFPDGQQWRFDSCMCHGGGAEVVEYVRLGLGLRMAVGECDGALRFEGLGYRWDLGPLRLNLPEWLLLGHARIEERALSATRFEVRFSTVHPLLGRTYVFSGRFELAAP